MFLLLNKNENFIYLKIYVSVVKLSMCKNAENTSITPLANQILLLTSQKISEIVVISTVDSSTVLSDLCRRYSCLSKDTHAESVITFILLVVYLDPSGETRKM